MLLLVLSIGILNFGCNKDSNDDEKNHDYRNDNGFVHEMLFCGY